MKELSPRQLAFAAAYAKHGVASRAAVEAGYSEKTAASQAERLLRNVGIRAEVERLGAKATEKAEVDVQRIVDELALIGFADLAEFVEWGPEGVRLKSSDSLDAVHRRAIVEVSESRNGLKIKLADKNSALEKLGRYLGMFVDKVEHSGKVETTAPVVNLTLTSKAVTGG